MIATLLANQKRALDYFFSTVNPKEIELVLQKISKCTGSVILSGIGKSGLIAKKISATLASIGIKSSFLHPLDALHGDIGSLDKEDLFLAFSKSGQSEELIHLISHVRKRGLFTIAAISQKRSKLANACHLSMYLPVEQELCPYNIVPTISTAVQLLFGDCLAIALMKQKSFSLKDFASNHPGGLLGRKTNFKVCDLMIKGPLLPLCRKEARVIDLLHELSVKRCGCLLIMNDKSELEGIFTDGDLRRAIQQEGPDALQKAVLHWMTQKPKTIAPDALALTAMEEMENNRENPITALPVIEEGRLIGLIRLHDIVQSSQKNPQENREPIFEGSYV